MFCNQCGTQVPDNSAVCPNCGAAFSNPQAPQQPMMGQPMPEQPMQGQPMMGQPMQGQPMMGQPMQGQPIYNGQPMPGYGMPMQPKSNPLGFLTAKQPGVPFPMKGLFSVKNLVSKITTIDLIGVIAAIVALISVFIPFIHVKYSDENYSMISSDMNDAGFKLGWFILIVAIAVGVLYFLRMEFMAFLGSCVNFLLFISAWTFGGATASGIDSINLSVGFWFYLLASVTLVAAPFIWMKIKKD
ncbi:MAG: zinc-ribbon domain-containing protein [Lachnospiraceae bacterium]